MEFVYASFANVTPIYSAQHTVDNFTIHPWVRILHNRPTFIKWKRMAVSLMYYWSIAVARGYKIVIEDMAMIFVYQRSILST